MATRCCHVFDGGRAAEQVVALENEPELLAPDAGERIAF